MTQSPAGWGSATSESTWYCDHRMSDSPDSPESSSPAPAEPKDTSSRHPWRYVLIGLAVLLAVGAAVFAYRWSQRGADEASTSDLLEQFRDGEGVGGSDGEFLQPSTGVYTYEATGSEKLSLLDTTQEWGPTMPASITSDGDGCWTWHVEYNTNHWQEQDLCADGNRLLETGGTSMQRFDFGAFTTVDTVVAVCEPPGEAIRADAEPGDTWSQSCVGRNEERDTEVTTAGTNTFVGAEEIEIGGETVATLHYLIRRTLSGDQTGEESTERWYSVKDGMLLRVTSDITVETPSPLGDVTFTQQGEFELESLTPDR